MLSWPCPVGNSRLGVAAEMRSVSRASPRESAAIRHSASSRPTDVADPKSKSAGGVEIQPCEAEHDLVDACARQALSLPRTYLPIYS